MPRQAFPVMCSRQQDLHTTHVTRVSLIRGMKAEAVLDHLDVSGNSILVCVFSFSNNHASKLYL